MLSPQSQASFDNVGYKCLEIYEEEKAKMKEILRKLEGQISLAVDILRSGKRYKCGSEYLCLITYFIDNDWNLKRWILSFSLLGREGEDVPHEIILKSLKDWDIERKVSLITMLTSNSYDEMLKVVKDHIGGMQRLQLNGRLFQVHCSAEMVNQVVLYAYGRISSIVDKIGKYHTFNDVVSTWKYRSTLLKDSFRYKVYIPEEVRAVYGLPADKDWQSISDVIDLVDGIYDIMYLLFELGYPTANIFLHHIQELQSYLIKKSSDSNDLIRSAAKNMLQEFSKYMNEMYLVLAIALVMDPRFKMKYIEFSSSKFEGDIGNSQVSMVLEAVENLYNEYVLEFPVKKKAESNSAPELKKKVRHREPPTCFKSGAELGIIHIFDEGLGLELLRENDQFINSTCLPTKSELECYLEEPVIPWSQDFDALGWWKASSSKYPTLSRMARDLMAIPVCIAVGDEATLMKQRKAGYCVISSGPEFMNAFMCIRDWFLKN